MSGKVWIWLVGAFTVAVLIWGGVVSVFSPGTYYAGEWAVRTAFERLFGGLVILVAIGVPLILLWSCLRDPQERAGLNEEWARDHRAVIKQSLGMLCLCGFGVALLLTWLEVLSVPGWAVVALIVAGAVLLM